MIEHFMEVMGWIGAAAVLGAYALLSAGKLSPARYAYHVLNLGGSLMLGVYALWHGAIASVAVNAIWMCIGVIAISGITKRRAKLP